MPTSRKKAPAPAPAPAPEAKPTKRKLVRDSFTIPADEYETIALLKQRAVALGRAAKKSEVLRAGLKVLSQMADKALHAALAAVPEVKTGRPKAKKAEAAAMPNPPKPPKAPKPAKASKAKAAKA
jgi:hypothetical protein